MDYTAAPLEKLIEEFGKFQGVGRKGATRMAYQVLSMSDKDAAALADAIRGAHTRLHRCRICQNFWADSRSRFIRSRAWPSQWRSQPSMIRSSGQGFGLRCSGGCSQPKMTSGMGRSFSR